MISESPNHQRRAQLSIGLICRVKDTGRFQGQTVYLSILAPDLHMAAAH